jgi:hypothetical protein
MPGSPNPPIFTPVQGDALDTPALLDALRAVAETAFGDRVPRIATFYGTIPPKVPGTFPVFWLEVPHIGYQDSGWPTAATGQTMQQRRTVTVLARLAAGTTQDSFVSLYGDGLPAIDTFVRGIAANFRLAFTVTDPGPPQTGGVLALTLTDAVPGPFPFAGRSLWGLTWTLTAVGLYTLQGRP